MARPTKLNPVLVKRILKSIVAGAPPEVAAVAAGVARTTYYRWMQDGAGQTEGPFREFRDAIEGARAKAEEKMALTIARAGKKGWQAALAWLERQRPKRWGKKTAGDGDTPAVDVNVKVTHEHTIAGRIDHYSGFYERLAGQQGTLPGRAAGNGAGEPVDS